ncbi:MAG: CocE/NonD family hydrolase [Planctomycetaceae bacterium]
MRDGKRLFTVVYVPKDQSQKFPIVISRTPYSVSPYGVDQYKADLGPSPLFGKDGFIFVYQDVRGRWMSEGDFVNMRPQIPDKKKTDQIDESSDTYDTVDWLINVPGRNGKVGLVISYPGFYTAAGIVDAIPPSPARPRKRRSTIGLSAATIGTTAGLSFCRTPSISWQNSAMPAGTRPGNSIIPSITAPGRL